MTTVAVSLLDADGKPQSETVGADMYLWDGDMDALSSQSWELDTFIAERLDDWIDLFDGMELTGEE